MAETFDTLVLGGGMRGLLAGLQARHTAPAALQVIEAAPWPGGTLRTQRTNGFVCELGAFAFGATELSPFQALLPGLPAPIAAAPAARRGLLHTATGDRDLAVDPPPLAFRAGNETLVQACRRQLGPALRLGRTVTAIEHDGTCFVVRLGGDVPVDECTRSLAVAVPAGVAGRLLSRFDPNLAAAAARVETAGRAFAFFGGAASAGLPIRGYGILPADDVATPVAEVIFCSEAFPDRALPGRFLIRVEISAPHNTTDTDVLAIAEQELRAWTGLTAEFGLRKLHRFEAEVPDGALVECKGRLLDLPRRVPGLTVL